MLRVRSRLLCRGSPPGFSMIELMVAVAIIAILAAIAIPVFHGFAKEARMSEAQTNIQGIIEAEEAYFVRFGHYTGPLTTCPAVAAPKASTQAWSACNDDWEELGWGPEGPVYFQYRVFSLYDDMGNRVNVPPGDGYAIDWATEIGNDLTTMQPWVAVRAWADTDDQDSDDDGTDEVVFGGNSYNQKVHRSSNTEY